MAATSILPKCTRSLAGSVLHGASFMIVVAGVAAKAAPQVCPVARASAAGQVAIMHVVPPMCCSATWCSSEFTLSNASCQICCQLRDVSQAIAVAEIWQAGPGPKPQSVQLGRGARLEMIWNQAVKQKQELLVEAGPGPSRRGVPTLFFKHGELTWSCK
jgi:hypothetical protein